LSGTVRVSTGECAAGFLARCLSGPTTTALSPGITLELVDSRQTANLARHEADVALRHQPPESGDFYISKAGTFACAVYRRRGADAGSWITYTEEQAHYEPARWVQRQVDATGKPVALRASSMLMHLEAIRAGTGRGVLPCYVGDGHPLLERLTPPIPRRRRCRPRLLSVFGGKAWLGAGGRPTSPPERARENSRRRSGG